MSGTWTKCVWDVSRAIRIEVLTAREAVDVREDLRIASASFSKDFQGLSNSVARASLPVL